MNYRHGLFRIWLVITVAALIGAPIFVLYRGLSTAGHACFKVLELQFKDAPDPAASGSLRRPLSICTDPALYQDPDRQTLEREWANLTALKIEYDRGDVETFLPAKGRDYVFLYVNADMKYHHAVFLDLLKEEVPVWDSAILILAAIIWWSGRLVTTITAWTKRGFRA